MTSYTEKSRVWAAIVQIEYSELVTPAVGAMEYLAYGSNMCSAWLRSRVPSAANPRVVALPGRVILYRKVSKKDGSAKADLGLSSDPSQVAYGVVFDIDPAELDSLRAAEGCGRGYHEETLEVVHEGQALRPFVYVADVRAVRSGLPPHDWYRDLVVAGAREHGLPANHVASLADVPTTVDPDSNRAADARRFCGGAV